jgi:hypothetical protein
MNRKKYAISVVVRAIAINSRCTDAATYAFMPRASGESQVTKSTTGLIHVAGPMKTLLKKKGIDI